MQTEPATPTDLAELATTNRARFQRLAERGVQLPIDQLRQTTLLEAIATKAFTADELNELNVRFEEQVAAILDQIEPQIPAANGLVVPTPNVPADILRPA